MQSLMSHTSVSTHIHTEFVPAVVGFERSLYNVTEGDGEVEVCVVILMPADPTTLNTGYNARLNFSTADDTAIGKWQCTLCQL